MQARFLSSTRGCQGLRSQRPFTAARPSVAARVQLPKLRVAAAEEQQTQAESGLAAEARVIPSIDPAVAQELELAELDDAQEQLLKWMMFTDEEAQEEDMDEMIDYDEFGDEEYEELYEELEELYDAAGVELKVGDKVVGTVYEVDEDGAYVEIGEKSSGFVPLSECSFAKLKTVGIKSYFSTNGTITASQS